MNGVYSTAYTYQQYRKPGSSHNMKGFLELHDMTATHV